jgi:hypothetical protein
VIEEVEELPMADITTRRTPTPPLEPPRTGN